MKTNLFVRTALWTLCAYFSIACGQQSAETQSFTSAIHNEQPEAKTQSHEAVGATVYVCNSSGAKKYHYKETCRGLSNCKHEVVTMELQSAEKRGLELCKWED